MPRQSLKEQLAEHRKQKAAGNYTRKLTSFGKVGETSYTEDGHIEAPTIYGLKWLRFLGEALVNQGVVWRAQVGTEQWERSGKIRLSLQRIRHEEVAAPVIRAGLALVTPGTVKVPMGGGVWESRRIPIGAVNAHDTAYVLRAIMTPHEANVVMASNMQIKAMHGR